MSYEIIAQWEQVNMCIGGDSASYSTGYTEPIKISSYKATINKAEELWQSGHYISVFIFKGEEIIKELC